MANNSKTSAASLIERCLAFPVEGTSWSYVLFALVIQLFLYDALNEVFPSALPLDDVEQSFEPGLRKPPAKRLVIFIGDGVRSQSLFNRNMDATPHLQDVVRHRGVSGVSHVSVPTESRAGHVAMLAGLREDLHSVTANWKEEAVHFDHLFNHSSRTFAWGSPAVLVMFPVRGKVHSISHHHSRENFAGDDAKTLLDEMYQNFTKTLMGISSTSKERLKQADRLVFFLHMISTDLGGHALKPHTPAYRELIGLIDSTVAKVEVFLERFFSSDGQTAYLFTADHGMTDWGAHGGGHMTETMTPVIAWGAGVSGPLREVSKLEQVDLCPLMAAILGVATPTNNRGRFLPSLLNLSDKDSALLMQANVRQLLQVFDLTKKKTRKSSLFFFFKDFDRLDVQKAKLRLKNAQETLQLGDAKKTTEQLESLALDIQAGLNFFARRERFFDWCCLVLCMVMWILCLAAAAFPPPPKATPLSEGSVIFCSIVLGSQAVILFLEGRSLTHWLLRLLPLFFLAAFIQQCRRLALSLPSFKALGHIVIAGLGLFFLINSFYRRQVVSLAFLTHVGWVLLTATNRTSKPVIAFIASAVVVAFAPLLPEVGANTQLSLVPFGAIFQLAFFVFLFVQLRLSGFQKAVCFMQLALIVCSLVTHRLAHETILRGQRLPHSLQMINWSILGSSLAISTVGRYFASISMVLLNTTLSVYVIYTLLGLSYEGIVILCLFINICSWAAMEREDEEDEAVCCWAEIFILKPAERISRLALFRFGFAITVMFVMSLLAPGHRASVSSYDPNSMFPLYTIFRPSIAIPLAFLKVVLPVFQTALIFSLYAASRSLADITKSALFFVNILSLYFLCFVKDDSSGVTAVGTSVGRYVIAMVLSLFAIVFFCVSRLLFRIPAEVKEPSGKAMIPV